MNLNTWILSDALSMARQKFPDGNLSVTACVIDRGGAIVSFVDVDYCGTFARGVSLSEALLALEAKLSPATLDSAIQSAEVAVKNAQGQLVALRAKRHALALAQAERKVRQ
jgi:uncharacterized protein GlcG (DUF336 family)